MARKKIQDNYTFVFPKGKTKDSFVWLAENYFHRTPAGQLRHMIEHCVNENKVYLPK